MASLNNNDGEGSGYNYECEPSDSDTIKVRMPNGDMKTIQMSVPPMPGAVGQREQRLASPGETVGDEKNRLLRVDGYSDATLGDYEMVIMGLHNELIVMDDSKHVSTYRAELCRARDPYLEIRRRANQNREPEPTRHELFGITPK
ncbi:hypothetical protein BsWGS_16951 [Bradybaena similaris]